MRPEHWNPSIELSEVEAKIIGKIRKAKLFIWLRQNRHILLDEQIQEELGKIYKDSTVGLSPVPPAQLALAIILQAYTGVSDDEVIEAIVMDRRWQLVLDCLEEDKPPFGKGTLVRFRAALMANNGDRLLIEKTVELAKTIGGYSSRSLRGALDSSPLWGAARVEDTYNLLGHALMKALSIIARQEGEQLEAIASKAGAEIITSSSLKAALDRDWDDKEAKTDALITILNTLAQVEKWIEEEKVMTKKVKENLDTARLIERQDIEMTSPEVPKLKKGVAKDRRISIEDSQMRHGRKSRSQKIDGYKRHILKDMDSGLITAVGITPANAPEASVTETMAEDLNSQQIQLKELHIDRAYLNCHWVKERTEELKIFCKAWPVRNSKHFPKTAFVLDWETYQISCPNGMKIAFTEGKSVRFPKSACQECPLKSQCTTSKTGRSISIHPDEALLEELRQRQLTSKGRAQLRKRVTVEHSLSHIGRWQGRQARYLGVRKNLFDLRRVAVVHNLHVLMQMNIEAIAC